MEIQPNKARLYIQLHFKNNMSSTLLLVTSAFVEVILDQKVSSMEKKQRNRPLRPDKRGHRIKDYDVMMIN